MPTTEVARDDRPVHRHDPRHRRSTRGLGEGRPDRHRRRRRLHRRVADPLLPRPGLHPHPRRRPQAAARTGTSASRASSPSPWTSAHEQNAIEAVKGAAEVYNLAADMGGMGFIENFRVECLRSILVNTHLIEAAYRAGVKRYFFSSSACAYNTDLQKIPDGHRAQGIRRLPGHGRARLRLGEADLRDVLPGVLGGARPGDRTSPASTTSTAPTAPGSAAARRPRRRCAAR